MTATADRIITPNTPAIPEEHQEVVPFGAQTSELVLWAYEAKQAAQIARSLARTSFVPASLRGKAEDITAAILAGQELGLKPMATLRSIDVIQGTPALRAHAQRGLVQSHGHSVQLVKSTKDYCLMRGRRKGEEEWQEVEWDLERAAGLGLLGKAEWKKQPKTMLVARATGEICRLVASDVLHAMPYNAEELRDGEEHGEDTSWVTAAEIMASVVPASTVQRPTPRVVEQEQSDVPDPRIEIIRLFNVVDLTTDDDRGAYVREVVGREVTGLGDLTPDETASLLAALQRFAAQSDPAVESAA